MARWSLEREDDYFRIFDRRKHIAGYFDPDYGPPQGGGGAAGAMIERGDPVPGGWLMAPLAKFGIFDTDYSSDLDGLAASLAGVSARADAWRGYLGGGEHYVRISHTDRDMLSITFPVSFPSPVPLRRPDLAGALAPVMDGLESGGLL